MWTTTFGNSGRSKIMVSGSRSAMPNYRKVVLSVPQIVGRIPDEMKLDFIHILNPDHHHRVSAEFKKAVEEYDWLNELLQKALRAPDLFKYLDSFEKIGKKVRIQKIGERLFAFSTRGRYNRKSDKPVGEIDARKNIVSPDGTVVYYDGDYEIAEETTQWPMNLLGSSQDQSSPETKCGPKTECPQATTLPSTPTPKPRSKKAC